MRLINKYSIQFALSLILFVSTSVSAGSELETIKDLRVLEEQASSSNLPVLLLFTAEECEYCEAIRAHYLEPMIRSGKYTSRVLFRQIYIEEFYYLRDLNGELVGGDQIALKYDVELTPTILFVNARGNELADRIVGVSAADYFDKTLDTHISQALSNFQK